MTLKDNLEGNHLRSDLAAGLVVFLVALPLCLGIALASGAPLLAGLIAGVVGGIVVGFFSGSEVSVSGPAAGLTVIVATAISNLGYQAFLASVLVAGLMQILFGTLRLGAIADYVPTSVIKGMLAAIGIVIFLKQIPHALGRDVDFEADMSFIEPDGKENTLSAIVKALLSANGAAVVVAGVSLFILLVWDKQVATRVKTLKFVPAPLVVVVVGTLLNEVLRATTGTMFLKGDDGHLVSLPILSTPTDLMGQLVRPSRRSVTNRFTSRLQRLQRSRASSRSCRSKLRRSSIRSDVLLRRTVSSLRRALAMWFPDCWVVCR
jgi:MFS superfamily sulfate permease-like transporter